MVSFEKRVKAIRNGMEFSHGMRRALFGALMLIYLISLGFDVIAITSLFAISTIAMFLFEFPTGAVADYDSRKKSLMISFFLMSVSYLGVFLFRNFWVIAGFIILQDIAWTFCSGASSAWVVDALNYAKKKSKLISLTSQGYVFEKIGHVIGGLVAMIIVVISFRFIWLVVSLNYFVLFLVSWKYMEDRNFKPEKVPHGYLMKSVIKAKESISHIIHKDNRDLRILMWSEFFMVIGFSGFLVGMPLLFVQILGLAPEYLAGIYSVVGVLAISGPLIANKFAQKYRFGKSLFLLMFIFGISIMAFAISGSLVVAVLTFAIAKISEAMFDTIIDAARQHEFESKIRASLNSAGMMIWAVGNSVGMFLVGFSVKYLGVVNTLLISGAIMFLTAFAFLWMKE
jgi:MFS family permease